MSEYPYRILLLYPQSRVAEIEAWYASQFPDAGGLLTPIGTKDGEEWFVSSFVATKNDVEKWLAVFGSNLQAEVPQGFVDLPREIQRQWIAGMQTAAAQYLGIWIDAAWNDTGENCDVEAALAAMAVTRISPQEI